MHARVITNAEEIAFYRGGAIEQSILERAYLTLVRQMNVIFNKRLWYVMLEQMLMKYLWSATGMVLIAAPIMLTGKKSAGIKAAETQSRAQLLLQEAAMADKFETEGLSAILATDDISERTQYMMTAKNILISGSDALERLLSSYKELIELVGYTNRVAKMFTVFEQVNHGQYKREAVVKTDATSEMSPSKSLNNCTHPLPVITFKDGVPEAKGVITEVDNYIQLDNVPVITPNCDIVVPSLTLKVSVHCCSEQCELKVFVFCSDNQRHALAHNGTERLRQVLTLSHPIRPLASLWWLLLPTQSSRYVLHSPEAVHVTGHTTRAAHLPRQCGGDARQGFHR